MEEEEEEEVKGRDVPDRNTRVFESREISIV